MKKNGFTLTEVIAVIVILSVIILMAVPAYLGITETLKNNQYDNKIKQISTKATEWATDNNITEDTTITIAKLVDDGYVDMDDETSDDKRVINPLNNESMECYHVEISIINGGYETKITESNDCELKILEDQEKNIKVTAYEFDPTTTTILNSEVIKLNSKEFEWTGKDVLLVTTSDVYKDPQSITFSTGSNNNMKTGSMYLNAPRVNEVINPDAYKNVFVVSASVILKAKYTIIYDMVSERPKRTVTVKIDKENPNGSYSMLEKWGTSEAKKLKLSGNDGAGSGVKGFYVSALNTNDINTATYYAASNNEKEVSLPIGVYYFWTEDNVGNKSMESNRIDVSNIDDTPPECVYPTDTPDWTKEEVKITWGCKDTQSGCATADRSITYNTEINKDEEIASVVVFNDPDKVVTVNGQKGEYIYDAAGNKTFCPARQIDVKFDNKAPSCSVTSNSKKGNNNWFTENALVKLTTEDKGSGLAKKGLSTNTEIDYNDKFEVTQGETKGVTYYGYVEDNLGNKTKCEYNLKVDTTGPVLNLGLGDIHNASVSCTDNISNVVSSTNYNALINANNLNYNIGLVSGANRKVDVTCTNDAGLSTSASHTYTYSGCAAGENTCQYGCDSCWDPCLSSYDQCHYGCDTESYWDSGLNCYNHPYSCSTTCTGSRWVDKTCNRWTNGGSGACYGASMRACGITCCTSCTGGHYESYSYSCSGTCYSYYCDGGTNTREVNCSSCKYTTRECQGGNYACNCSNCHTGHNTCQEGFIY